MPLPPGLSLDSATGVISGVPTSAGASTYVAKVTDASGQTAMCECTIVITPPPGFSGRRSVVYVPNPYDNCLHREFRVYSQIDYERLGCARLPSCFKVDERLWDDPPCD